MCEGRKEGRNKRERERGTKCVSVGEDGREGVLMKQGKGRL